MAYADAGGVHTWYAEYGSGRPLLLHGAFTDASEFSATVPALAQHFRVLTPERRGHGHTPDVDGPISYDLMADPITVGSGAGERRIRFSPAEVSRWGR
jgi:pimeloyl-ACP methyl ester carboxylesterase